MEIMIKSIRFKKIELSMKRPFKIALGTTSVYEGYYVSVEASDGIVGYGEAVPTPFITGDTMGSIEDELKVFSKELIGSDESPETINKKMKQIMKASKASRNAVDCAIWDILGKRANMNLVKLLGNNKKSIATSYTIDLVDAEQAEAQAKELLKQGIKVFKIKMGTGMESDIERVRRVREVIGEKPMIYVDFNQSYAPKKAAEISKKLEAFNIEFLEQPVRSDDISGLKYVRDNSSIPVFADESVFTPKDLAEVLSREAVDGVNIKLMKSGGITDAIKMVDTAESFGVPVMIGCMVETRLANTCGLAVALSKSGVVYADLDGYSGIKEDPVEKGIVLNNGEVTLDQTIPGIGVLIKEDFTP